LAEFDRRRRKNVEAQNQPEKISASRKIRRKSPLAGRAGKKYRLRSLQYQQNATAAQQQTQRSRFTACTIEFQTRPICVYTKTVTRVYQSRLRIIQKTTYTSRVFGDFLQKKKASKS
jgi:hypothetical protein